MSINIARHKTDLILLAIISLLIGAGLWMDNIQRISDPKALDYGTFADELRQREKKAQESLEEMRHTVKSRGLWAITRNEETYKKSANEDIAYYIIDGDEFKFWSTAAVDVRSSGQIPYDEEFYFKANNYHCVGLQTADEKYRYVALVKVKQCDHPVRKSQRNAFVKGLNLPTEVTFSYINDPDAYIYRGIKNSSLFALHKIVQKAPSRTFDTIYTSIWLLALLSITLMLLRIRYKAEEGETNKILAVLVIVAVYAGMTTLSFEKTPSLLYKHEIFSPIYYASDTIPSIGHLVIFSLFTIGTVLLLSTMHFGSKLTRSIPKAAKVAAGQTICMIAMWGVYELEKNIVYNSTMDVAVSQIEEVTLLTISAIAIIVAWTAATIYISRIVISNTQKDSKLPLILTIQALLLGLGAATIYTQYGIKELPHMVSLGVLMLLLDVYLYKYKKMSGLFVSLLAFIVVNQTIATCHEHCEQRNMCNYQILASNLTENQSLMQDPIAESLMPELSYYIKQDQFINRALGDSTRQWADSVRLYVQQKYMSGYWDRYEADIQIADSSNKIQIRKSGFGDMERMDTHEFEKHCIPVSQSYFGISLRNDLPVAYIGRFDYDSKKMYLVLYPNLNYNKTIYIENKKENSGESMEVSVAKYNGNSILYMNGEYPYPSAPSWIPNSKEKEFHFSSGNVMHFVSKISEGEGLIVVSKQNHRTYSHLIFASYMYAAYMVIYLIIILLDSLSKWKQRKRKSIKGRMQIWFLVPLLASFLLMGILSSYFFIGTIKRQEVNDLSRQASNAQQKIQNEIGFDITPDKHLTEMTSLLKSMSDLYQADLFVYNTKGNRVTSSRAPLIQNIARKGRLMRPEPINFMKGEHFCADTENGVDYYSFLTRIYNRKNQFVGYIEINSIQAAQRARSEVMNLIIVLVDIYLVVVLLTIVISWLISHRISKPISMLAERFKEVKLQGSNSKIEYRAEDEVGVLVDQYNIMVDKLEESAKELAKNQRDMAWAEMARQVAHEVKNSLTPMRMNLELTIMKRARHPENFDSIFDRCVEIQTEQIDSLTKIASDFSRFAKSLKLDIEDVDIVEKLDSATTTYGNTPDVTLCTFNTNGIEHLEVRTDRNAIIQVFNNLYQNAIQAEEEGKQGIINADLQKEDDYAVIRISDNGCGIKKENLETIFQPYFTTKSSGTGLGLGITKSIIEQSGGTIKVESEEGKGTTFEIKLPLSKKQ